MTIAEQLNITKFPFEILNKAGLGIYSEDSDGYWVKGKFDSKGNRIYWEHSDGRWIKWEYDSQGNTTYWENSYGVINVYR